MWLKFEKITHDIEYIRNQKLEQALVEKGYHCYYSHNYQQFTIEYRTPKYIVRFMHFKSKPKDVTIPSRTSIHIDVITRDTIQMKSLSRKVFHYLRVKKNHECSSIVESLLKDITEISEVEINTPLPEEKQLVK